MESRAAREYRYEKLTWPEINDAVELGQVCIVPCGSVEQHAPHLPLDTDIVCPAEIARGAGRRAPEKLLVLPPIAYGYTGHVMDFPGTIKDRPVDARRDWHRKAPTIPMPWGQRPIKS